jgi:hypothetical protein
MKNKSIILKVIVSVVAVAAVICAVSLTRDLMKKHRIETRKPILKVMSRSSGGWITSGKEHFYIVYDNGDYEETEEFQCSGTEVYKLYMVDDIETDLEGMPAYAKNIIEYADNLENSNIFNLYVIGDRCFFDIHDSRGMRKKYTSTVFEYFPDDNSVKRIVQFKDYYTQYVELY